jgi:hypothetical protein
MNNLNNYDDNYLINNTNTNLYVFNKTLVLYTFHEDNYNVRFFIKNGIFKSPYVDFVLICNNETLKVKCPDYVIYINRKNIGYDFGGWSEGLFKNDLYKNYNCFIFVNSSVIGPITTNYYKNEWINIFLEGLKGDVKLYGSMINTCGYNQCMPETDSHVQSYAYCMNIDTLNYLIKKEIFSLTNIIDKYKDVVNLKEIRMSREILNNNWNIGCIFHHYNNIDFRNKEVYSRSLFNSYVNPAKYYNEHIHPYELVFIKEKYIINKDWINKYTKFDESEFYIKKNANNNLNYLLFFIFISIILYFIYRIIKYISI